MITYDGADDLGRVVNADFAATEMCRAIRIERLVGRKAEIFTPDGSYQRYTRRLHRRFNCRQQCKSSSAHVW